MKVLLINHFPLEGSGSGTYTKNIALHLRKRGHEVCVIFPENRQVLMLPGIRMFPVMFSAGKASWSSLPFIVGTFLRILFVTQYVICNRTVFQEICRHEMLGDFSADKYLNLENLQKSS